MHKTPKKNIITLVGLMGVGKSETAKCLEQLSHYPIFDSDQQIEMLEQKSIKDIFETDGEAYFRTKEREIIANLVRSNKQMILATGGGAFCQAEIADLLLKHSFVIWLKCAPEHIVKRLEEDKTRPLLLKQDKLTTLQELALKRDIFYQKADFTIDTNNKTPIEVAEKIWQEFQKKQ